MKNPSTFLNRKMLFISISVIILIIAIFIPPYSFLFTYIAGKPAKLEVIKLIGLGIGGVIAILGVTKLFKRVEILDEHRQIAEKGHIQDRFKAATKHLGSEQVSERVAAFYEFYHLGKIEETLQAPIFDILCFHLRQSANDPNITKPTEEVQSLLNILFEPRNRYRVDKNGNMIEGKGKSSMEARGSMAIEFKRAQIKRYQECFSYSDIWINLEGINLQGANLQGASLEGANLRGADLRGANLQEAGFSKLWNYQGGDLRGANLQGANLQGANLFKAEISKTTTTMPNGWENIVKKNDGDKPGVIFVED